MCLANTKIKDTPASIKDVKNRLLAKPISQSTCILITKEKDGCVNFLIAKHLLKVLMNYTNISELIIKISNTHALDAMQNSNQNFVWIVTHKRRKNVNLVSAEKKKIKSCL